MSASLESIIIGFPETHFSGEIATELAQLIDSGLIRLVDLVLVAKGEDGTLAVLEVDEDEGASALAALDGEVGGVIGPEDIEHAAASIDGGTALLMIVWEDLWARPFGDALRRAGGELIEGLRIPGDLAETLEPTLAGAG